MAAVIPGTSAFFSVPEAADFLNISPGLTYQQSFLRACSGMVR
jgi:hypothetical protein